MVLQFAMNYMFGVRCIGIRFLVLVFCGVVKNKWKKKNPEHYPLTLFPNDLG